MIIAAFALAFTTTTLQAQQTEPQKPVKTGNEWKMPGDVVQRSQHFADSLKKKFALDDATTKKVFEAYLVYTKPVDEISVTATSEKDRKEKLKANHEAFNDKLKGIMTAEQFQKYMKADGVKMK
jgi:hypothetical protein